MTSSGRVWKFGDDVNTDLIIPGKYLDNYDPAHLADHAMEGARKEFSSQVRRGDMIVAGRNFGCGSSREQAVIALRHAGIAAIVAKSFARIFYRNAVNLGLLVVVSPDACDVFDDLEVVTLDAPGGCARSTEREKVARLEQVPPHVVGILESGGLIPHIKIMLRSGTAK